MSTKRLESPAPFSPKRIPDLEARLKHLEESLSRVNGYTSRLRDALEETEAKLTAAELEAEAAKTAAGEAAATAGTAGPQGPAGPAGEGDDMAGTRKRLFGPLALTTTLTTNVYQGAGGSALIYDVLTRIHIANKTAGAVTFSLWLGATGANAAGTELFVGKSIAANDHFDYDCNLRMGSTDFLVGGSNTTTALAITGEGEQHVV